MGAKIAEGKYKMQEHKVGRKGSINRDCEISGVAEETLKRIWQCEEARKEMARWMVVTLKGLHGF